MSPVLGQCPQCGSLESKHTGWSKDKTCKVMRCLHCGRRYLEDPERQIETIRARSAKRKAELRAERLARKRQLELERKRAEPKVRRRYNYCEDCGKPLLGNAKKCQECWLKYKRSLKERQYRCIPLEREGIVPYCPSCGVLMVKQRGKWSCENERCPVINLYGTSGHVKLVFDAVLRRQELLLEV